MSAGTTVHVAGVPFGRDHFTTVAGPCAIESYEMALETALSVKTAGASVLRGALFKPRTSPHSFQGLGREGFDIVRAVKAATGMPIVTELTDVRHLDELLEVADCIQVGARSMQNYPLLTELGKAPVPVVLKRGLAATVDELLSAADYILCNGNEQVILCERGIRTYESAYRFTLDLAAVAVLRERTHLPVIVDPSHAAGRRELVLPLSLAAVAAGADGLIVEVHPNPSAARCDGDQALETREFLSYMDKVRSVAFVVGRSVPDPRLTPTAHVAVHHAPIGYAA